MKAHWLYLVYVVKHKWFVFVNCVKLGVVWRGIVHDWTKFQPCEWFPYARYFYGPKVAHPTIKIMRDGRLDPLMEVPTNVKSAFDAAWNHHQKRNDHHWQYWLLSPDIPKPTFSFQSYDDGVTYMTVSRVADGKDAALVYGFGADFKADPDAEHQLRRELSYVPMALPMPDVCRREMLADWRGAGRALGKPDTEAWYQKNRDKMNLHPDTRKWIEDQFEFEKQYARTDRAFKAGLFG